MKIQLFFLSLSMSVLFTGCLNDGSVSSREEETKNIAAENIKNDPVAQTSNTPVKTTVAGKSEQSDEEPRKTAQSFLNDDLTGALPNLLGGNFFLIKSYEPPFLIGDFNGDGYSDAAVVVGAQDRNGEKGEMVNPVENLCYLTVDVSFQNIITGGFVPARPRQSCAETEKKKSVLQAKQSQYGLFVVFGDKQGLQNVSRKDDAFGRKFLLLDAVYQNENIQKVTADAKGKFAVKVRSCVPANVKSDVIASVNSDGGTLAIYFDGKKFNYKQCGD